MTYPVNYIDVKDQYARGQISIFAKVVELKNAHPDWIDDAVIDEIYRIVEDVCVLTTKRIVSTMPSGEEVTE